MKKKLSTPALKLGYACGVLSVVLFIAACCLPSEFWTRASAIPAPTPTVRSAAVETTFRIHTPEPNIGDAIAAYNAGKSADILLDYLSGYSTSTPRTVSKPVRPTASPTTRTVQANAGSLAGSVTRSSTSGKTNNSPQSRPTTTTESKQSYVINLNSGVFHLPSCGTGKRASNTKTVTAFRSDLIADGYTPCRNCDP